MKLEELQNEFRLKAPVDLEGLVYRSALEDPFRVYGLMYEGGKFRRLPEAVARSANDMVYKTHTCTSGGRLRFQTDSPYVAVAALYDRLNLRSRQACLGSSGFDLYERREGREYFVGAFPPPTDAREGYRGILAFAAPGMRELTLNFPTYNEVNDLYIGLDRNAQVLPPREYGTEKPIVFYGSCFFQGSGVSRPGCAFPNILSRTLDCHFVNLGFSGGCHAEPVMADYIAGLDMTALVLDAEGNAQSMEELLPAHEDIYHTVRERQPDLPIWMLTRPYLVPSSLDRRMRDSMRDVCRRAVDAGDKNLYFIPGSDLIEGAASEVYLVDGIHPNDIGHFFIGTKIAPKLKEILGV